MFLLQLKRFSPKMNSTPTTLERQREDERSARKRAISEKASEARVHEPELSKINRIKAEGMHFVDILLPLII